MTRRIVFALTAAAALAASGAALAQAGGGDPHPSAADGARAGRAAVAETGGGRVNAVELDGERGATYEVEVRKPDGVTVDVRLDDTFGVVAVDADSGG